MTDGLWLAALLPVLTLFLLVLFGRLKTTWSAGIALALAVALAGWLFQAPPATIIAGAGKGLWLGTWILCVIVPALLLYRLAREAGMEHLGETFARYLPGPTDRLLLLAWIFPSFIQGVAGFGTPIAVCAPLLLMVGYDKIRAVVLPLVGYHWSVTFGSMGSSFYMASLTAGFGISAQGTLALHAAGLLAVNIILAGGLVLIIDGGLTRLRQGSVLLFTAGPVMAAVLIIAATAVPAIASLAAGAAGLLALTVKRLIETRLSRKPSGRPPGPPPGPASAEPSLPADATDKPADRFSARNAITVLAPYGYLLLLVLPIFLITPTRRFVTENLELAPSFDRSTTGRGWINEPIDGYLPIPVLGHPGFYIVLACLFGWLTYRTAGLWRSTTNRQVVLSWLVAVKGSAPTILVLGMLAMVLVDAGMVTTLATGIADVAGSAYPGLSPIVGSIGSFMTGSSTASNALFAALQAEVAGLVGARPEILVAAQAAGSNVGNSISPVIVLIGAAAVGAVDRVGEITRRCLIPVVVLLIAVIAGVLIRLAA